MVGFSTFSFSLAPLFLQNILCRLQSVSEHLNRLMVLTTVFCLFVSFLSKGLKSKWQAFCTLCSRMDWRLSCKTMLPVLRLFPEALRMQLALGNISTLPQTKNFATKFATSTLLYPALCLSQRNSKTHACTFLDFSFLGLKYVEQSCKCFLRRLFLAISCA